LTLFRIEVSFETLTGTVKALWQQLYLERSIDGRDSISMILTGTNMLFMYGVFTNNEAGHLVYDLSELMAANRLVEYNNNIMLKAIRYGVLPKIQKPSLLTYKAFVIITGGMLEEYSFVSYENFILVDLDNNNQVTIKSSQGLGFYDSFTGFYKDTILLYG
jgi:hypothetical protein